MSNMNELRELPQDQLENLIDDLNKEIFELRNQLAITRKLENPNQLREKRKDRARTILALSEKKKQKGE